MTHDSYWTRSTRATDYPVLGGRATVDVAVIGGGMTGLWTAWELAQAGVRVAVVEAGRIASATTGNTTGKASALQTLGYSAMMTASGADATRNYAQSQLLAVERLAEVVASQGIDCDLEFRPAYTYTTLERSLPALRIETSAAAQAGLPTRLTADAGLPFPIAGAVRLDGQLQFHVRKLLLALAADLVRQGSLIFENSRVTSVDDGEPCVAVTESGAAIVADHVVIATGYPISATPAVRRALRIRRELVIAGAVPADRVPRGMYITPEESVRSIRSAPLDAGHRLLIVAGEMFDPGAGRVRERYEKLAAWAATHLGLEDVRYRWSAQDYATADNIPLVGRASGAAEHRHTWVATGFGGWGLSNAVVAGRLIAADLAGGAPPPPWAGWFAPARLEAAGYADGAVETPRSHGAVRRRIEPDERAAVAALRHGDGAVIDVGGEHCAVYRDHNGIVHAVSAVCTHMGGTVGFNDAERTWECPCHGSRFDINGAVLQGPAVRQLGPATALPMAMYESELAAVPGGGGADR